MGASGLGETVVLLSAMNCDGKGRVGFAPGRSLLEVGFVLISLLNPYPEGTRVPSGEHLANLQRLRHIFLPQSALKGVAGWPKSAERSFGFGLETLETPPPCS